MHPILASFGPITIYTFGFFAALGFTLSTYTVWKIARAREWNEEAIFDTILTVTVAGIIAARVIYIFLHPFEFEGDISRMVLFLRYPGLSFLGGLAGASIVALFWVRRYRLPWKAVLDALAFGALIAHVFGSLGCFFNACMYGTVTYLPWGVVVPGLLGKRHPVSLYFVLFDLAILLFLWRIALGRVKPGVTTAWFFVLMGVVSALIEEWRGDSVYWFGFRAHQLIAALISIPATVVLYRVAGRSLLEDGKKARTVFGTLLSGEAYQSLSVRGVFASLSRPWREIVVSLRQWKLTSRARRRTRR